MDIRIEKNEQASDEGSFRLAGGAIRTWAISAGLVAATFVAAVACLCFDASRVAGYYLLTASLSAAAIGAPQSVASLLLGCLSEAESQKKKTQEGKETSVKSPEGEQK